MEYYCWKKLGKKKSWLTVLNFWFGFWVARYCYQKFGRFWCLKDQFPVFLFHLSFKFPQVTGNWYSFIFQCGGVYEVIAYIHHQFHNARGVRQRKLILWFLTMWLIRQTSLYFYEFTLVFTMTISKMGWCKSVAWMICNRRTAPVFC